MSLTDPVARSATPGRSLDEWRSIRGAFFYCQRAQTGTVTARAGVQAGGAGPGEHEERHGGWKLGTFNVTVYFTPQSGHETNTLICTHPVHCDGSIERRAPRDRARLPAERRLLSPFSRVPGPSPFHLSRFSFIGRDSARTPPLPSLLLAFHFCSFYFLAGRAKTAEAGRRSCTCRMKTILDRALRDL